MEADAIRARVTLLVVLMVDMEVVQLSAWINRCAWWVK
jgi:hypothetical protein